MRSYDYKGYKLVSNDNAENPRVNLHGADGTLVATFTNLGDATRRVDAFVGLSPPVRKQKRFNWHAPCQYNEANKARFHNRATTALRKLARALELAPGTYEIRRNRAGIAVSGEITLHGDHIYVQISQPFGGFDSGVLYRRCRGRRDYTGGRNHFESLDTLNAIEVLATRIERNLGPPISRMRMK